MNRIIKYTLDTGDTSVLDKMPRTLMSEQEMEWVVWIKKQEMIYDALPSLSAFKLKYPMFIELSYGSKNDLLRNAIERKKKQAINNTLAKIDPSDVDASSRVIEELRDKLALGPSELVSMSRFNRKEAYGKTLKSHFIISDGVTNEIGGVRDGEMMTIIGKYGTAKSLVAEHSVVKWLMRGERILVISNDMSPTATAMRLDNFLVHSDVSAIDEKDLSILDKIMNVLYNSLDGEIILPSRPVSFVSEIIGLVKQERATILLVDGAYMIRAESTKDKGTRNWESISQVTGELTHLAHSLNIPIILISQASRTGDIAYSNSFGQDSDIVIKLSDDLEIANDDDDMKIVMVETIKNRRGKPYKGYIQIDFKKWEVYDTKFVSTT
jgi:archaellum biogenesis ATPase FlaH